MFTRAGMPRPPGRRERLLLLLALLPALLRAEAPPPSWVERFPHDPDRYIGIGRADKRSHPGDYRELAQTAALAQISREISVEVKAENTATQTESGKAWEDAYAQRISTATRNELTGYLLEEVYETGTGFWALYSLDKDVFRKSLDEKERRFAAWLDGEAAALDSDLEARRIQMALDRLERIRKEYETAWLGHPLLRNRSGGIPERYAAASGKVETAVRRAMLSVTPSAWTFSLAPRPAHRKDRAPNGAGGLPSGAAVFLSDAASGARWKGPLSLTLTERFQPEKGPCEVETDAEGRLDLAHPFLECGLDPGAWRLSWMGPGGRDVHIEVEADWARTEMALSIQPDRIRPDGIRADGIPVAGLQAALAGMKSPYCAIVPGAPGGRPILEVGIREVTLDSLDGVYFSSLRAVVTVPGLGGPLEVRGKAGHADKDRAKARAIADFVKAVEGLATGNRLVPRSGSKAGSHPAGSYPP
jgi:hypothetical protein